MNKKIISDLIKVANSLDSKNMRKEANQIDLIIRKMAQDASGLGEYKNLMIGPDGKAKIFTATEAGATGASDPRSVYAALMPIFNAVLPYLVRPARNEKENLMKEEVHKSWAQSVATMMSDLSSHKDMKTFWNSFNSLLTEVSSKRTVHIEEGGDADKPMKGRPVPSKGDGLLTQDPSKSECKPNGQPLIRLPGDTKYGYQLAEDGGSYRAYRLSDCKFLGTFNDEDGLKKVKDAAPKAAEPSPAAEVTDETIEKMPVNPNADSIAALRDLRGRVEAASETRRFEQDGPTVQEAQKLLGIKNITPLAPGVRRKYLLKLIDKGIAKLQGDSADDLFMSEAASRSNDRISKFASLLSGEFGGLDKKIRR